MKNISVIRNTWLGWGHTISSGEPFAESTKLCGAMLLNPGVFGEPSYFCTLPDGDEVNFYQLIPLYKEEMEFKLENSVDELIDKCPDEILEVINPTRLNAITDEDTIGYDLAEMDNAESHLKRIRDLHLPVDELAAYNSMAVYLRWAMERGQMSNPFLTQYRNVVETVRAGNGPDLRVFIRDKLDGKLSTQFFDRVGSGFAQWYAQDNRSNPYVYLWDYRDCALAVLKDHEISKDTAKVELPDEQTSYAGYFFTRFSEDNRQNAENAVQAYIRNINRIFVEEFKEAAPLDENAKIEILFGQAAQTFREEAYQQQINGESTEIEIDLIDWCSDMLYKEGYEDIELMTEALYHINCDYLLSDYLQWPMYDTKRENPFRPYFELWKMGLKI